MTTLSDLKQRAHEISLTYDPNKIREWVVGWKTFKEIGGGNAIPMPFEGLAVRPTDGVPEGRLWPR